jgi:hypothetical protein
MRKAIYFILTFVIFTTLTSCSSQTNKLKISVTNFDSTVKQLVKLYPYGKVTNCSKYNVCGYPARRTWVEIDKGEIFIYEFNDKKSATPPSSGSSITNRKGNIVIVSSSRDEKTFQQFKELFE